MGIAQDLKVAARRWATARRAPSPIAAGAEERESLRRWFAELPQPIRKHSRDVNIFELEASQLPWLDTGIDLLRGESVSTFAAGRVVLSPKLDLWIGPQFQFWMRIGEKGSIFNGTRDTHSFRAQAAGRLYLAGCFPGQWHDREGRVSTPLSDYRKFQGGLTVAVIRWKGSATEALAAAAASDTQGRLAAEGARLREPVPPPDGWDYLWFIGQSEIFRTVTEDGKECIACETERNVSILQHDAVMDLEPGTSLGWSWKVDELPSLLPENTAASHDYLSIAVEFENGRDITYTWSPVLSAGTGYWCPLASWKDREFHVVVRSGSGDLGKWLAEKRDLHADYKKYMGEPPKRVIRVWLIAVSLFQRKRGKALFRDIRFEGKGGKLEIETSL